MLLHLAEGSCRSLWHRGDVARNEVHCVGCLTGKNGPHKQKRVPYVLILSRPVFAVELDDRLSVGRVVACDRHRSTPTRDILRPRLRPDVHEVSFFVSVFSGQRGSGVHCSGRPRQGRCLNLGASRQWTRPGTSQAFPEGVAFSAFCRGLR